jgi:hypothetical protein
MSFGSYCPTRKVIYLVVRTFPCPCDKFSLAALEMILGGLKPPRKCIYLAYSRRTLLDGFLPLAISLAVLVVALVFYSPQGNSVSW